MNIAGYLNQKAVYWGNPVNDGYGGYTYDDPVEVDVRWTDKQERFLSSKSSSGLNNLENQVEELLSNVVVLSETDFEVNGIMMLGELTDLDSDLSPDNQTTYIIKSFQKIPTKYADQFLRKVYLV